jgi:hypothetical protein
VRSIGCRGNSLQVRRVENNCARLVAAKQTPREGSSPAVHFRTQSIATLFGAPIGCQKRSFASNDETPLPATRVRHPTMKRRR